MYTKDLNLLEFPRVRDILAGYCSFSLSRGLASTLEPSTDGVWIRSRLAEADEAQTIIGLEPGISIRGASDISTEVEGAGLGRILDLTSLAECRRTLGLMRRLKTKLGELSEEAPALYAISAEISDFSQLESRLDKTVSPEGELLPTASGKLASIRDRLRFKRTEIIDRLQGFIQSDTARRYIQEPIVTEREGRFAIPVKVESRGEVKGIVHDVSNSGATIFVEPFATLELGNEFKQLGIEESREIERILTEVSAAVGALADKIASSLDAAARIDLAIAKGRYALRSKSVAARVFEPSGNDHLVLGLKDARHPLLGDLAVPLTLTLGKDFSFLVITGPNTGGKTVALKTIGLLCLMTQAGLPIPASDASVPIFDNILADIGDEQSVQQALSTFSGHISNIARILGSANGRSLVLLDELGASTDPQEGSALARAILLHLKAAGALGAATSHYTDLKVFAHVTPGIQNGSFDFDLVTLKPTYHLTMGMPGGSNAIATAARFGIPGSVILTAREFLAEGVRQLEELLTELQAEKCRLADTEKSLNRQKDTLERRNASLAGELKNLKQERQAIIQRARDSIVEEVAALQKDLKLARLAIEREKSQAALAMAREVSDSVRGRLAQGIFQPEVEKGSLANKIIAVGDKVWLKEAGLEANVISFNEKTGQLEVAAGPLRFKLDRLGVVKCSGAASRNTEPKISIRSVGKPIGLELDLRGKRADEIEHLLDEYLNDAASANLSEVRIIHGFGTGAVRAIVRDLAARHPLVSTFRSAPPDQGGDGATVLRLR